MHSTIEASFVDIVEYPRGEHETVYLTPVDKSGAQVSLKPMPLRIHGYAKRAGMTAFFTGEPRTVFEYAYTTVPVPPKRWSRKWWLRQHGERQIATRGDESGAMWVAGLAVYDEHNERISTHVFPQEASIVAGDLTIEWLGGGGYGLVYWRQV